MVTILGVSGGFHAVSPLDANYLGSFNSNPILTFHQKFQKVGLSFSSLLGGLTVSYLGFLCYIS